MDIQREGVAQRRRRIRTVVAVVGVILASLAAVWLWGLEAAPPSVRRSEVFVGTVQRGEMIRRVRGPGTLVPVETRWIPARTEARVESKVILPGAEVEPDSVILVLSNPQLEQETQDAELQLKAAEAEYADTQVELQRSLLNEQATAAAVESEYRQAVLQLEADEQLAKEGLKPELELKLSRVRAEELEARNKLEQERLAFSRESIDAQLASQRARLEQAQALYRLRQAQLEALQVKAGIRGVLQQIPVDVGQQVAPGANLARVAQPDKLRAELRIPETQTKDVAVGQRAEIDTRNGVIEGRVTRIDPAVQNGTVTVDVALVSELPRGARPDLSVDGMIELERLDDVLYVDRPAFGQADSIVRLFLLERESDLANRVEVKLGRTSVTFVEVVSGLSVGDEVILSDTARWNDFDRIRLN